MFGLNKATLLVLTAISSSSFAIELPSIPFPAPGSDEILFVVRNVTKSVNVSIQDYWSNRSVKRVPFKNVRNQSVMSTGGSKWLTSYLTVNINGNNYTMGAVSGYKNGSSAVFTKIKQGELTHDYSAVASFVGDDITEPNNDQIDETPEYFVSSETYDSGSGTVMVLCVSDKTTLNQCRNQS